MVRAQLNFAFGPFRRPAFPEIPIRASREALAILASEEAPPEDDAHIVPVRQERLCRRYRELDESLAVEWAEGQRDAIPFALGKLSIPRVEVRCRRPDHGDDNRLADARLSEADDLYVVIGASTPLPTRRRSGLSVPPVSSFANSVPR